MVVDDAGRAWLGNFGFDLMGSGDVAPTVLLRIDPDGSVTVVADDVWFPNGSIVTPDGVLLVDETFANRVSAFDIADDGSLRNRRVFAQFAEPPAAGPLAEVFAQIAVAPDGWVRLRRMWIADAVGGRAIRVREGGEIVDEVAPGSGVFACMLGGADGRTLFLCCAPDFDEQARTAAREAEIRAITVNTPRRPPLTT